ncbi:hypothetical protein M9H77_06584 [Catharanthus roseus]|uniref:Uncharacterized protein n=1 Tax=Catharanthus roseus TaxID=4058 RepID=A0ACC0BSI5_CATRO|nr:hypothetical protein M9H77_06584 [Catharanthus roseus]
MVKVKNTNIGKGENVEEGGSSRVRSGKRKRVTSGEATNFEEWTRKRRKIAPVVDPIGVGKIYNKYTFKRMGFERNEEGMLVRGRQDESDEDNKDDEGDEEQEEINVEEEKSDEEPEEETHKREIRQKNRQERAEEGLSSGSMTTLMYKIASLQASVNSRFDALDGHFDALDGCFEALDGKFYIEEQKMHKRSLKGNLHRCKRSLKTISVYEDEVIKLHTLKTRRLVRVSRMHVLKCEGKSKFSRKIGFQFLIYQNEKRSSDFFKGMKKCRSSYLKPIIRFFEVLKNRVIRFSVYKKMERPILKTSRPVFTFTVKK